jgi:hypothetical protein
VAAAGSGMRGLQVVNATAVVVPEVAARGESVIKCQYFYLNVLNNSYDRMCLWARAVEICT